MPKYLFFCLLFSVIFYSNSYSQSEEIINLTEGWKFMPGDNLNYAKPEYDDSNWKVIQVNKIWEEQGYEKLDGFAWYRIKVIIPSTLKNNAFLKDSLKIFPGKINNCDQAFINGQIFGINGNSVSVDTKPDTGFCNAPTIFYDMNRRYTISTNDPRILWDKENVIAFRVFDQGGQGGIYTGNAFISMVSLKDYLFLNCTQIPFDIVKGAVSKEVTLKNTGYVNIKGDFNITGVNKTNKKVVLSNTGKYNLAPGEVKKINIKVGKQDESTFIEYLFTFAHNLEKVKYREETPYVLTPAASLSPKINGARVYGQRPGRPFLYKIAASGEKPITYNVSSLPEGLFIDKSTGIIKGIVCQKGEYTVMLSAKNKRGIAKSTLKIIIGDEIALTPPMGWNSWNCWGLSIDQDKVIASAHVYAEKGLSDHGWSYINIDDGWEIKGDSPSAKRDAMGKIIVNEKFPNMKTLGDSIHALGLKFGIYSSPGTLTCGGYTASYQHELQDAQSYSDWGIDYLKYDWCSYEEIAKDTSLEERMKPYSIMKQAFEKIDRDIVFSLCQYGMSNVWKWGKSVGGNLWRTTGDITDTWQSLSEIGFNQVENAKYAGPGHWNDPDMLVVGWVGWGPNLHPTRLTPDEQYTHISLWCLLSSPLLIGCDLTKLDEFTLNLLTNDEVLAINQDPLGEQAIPVIKNKNIQVWKKKLADGSFSLGIFNLGDKTENYKLDFSEAGISTKAKVRDLWRQRSLGVFNNYFECNIPSHGVILIKSTLL